MMANPFDKFDNASGNAFDKFDNPGAAAEDDSGFFGSLIDSLAGAGAGLGKTVLGAQHYVGKGLQAIDDATKPNNRNIRSTIAGKKKRDGIGAAGDWLVDDAAAGRAKLTRELDPHKARSPMAAGAGELAGDVIATLPVGGVIAKGAGKLLTNSRAAPLLEAIRTGGFRTGLPAATTLGAKAANLGTRAVGGAVTGGASAALVSPGDGDSGAAVGASLPLALKLLGKTGDYVGRVGSSLVAPYTQKGQDRIVGNILNRFAEGMPARVDARELVPGSVPTLAEATGNAGLAGLQRTARAVDPNRFVPREQANATARSAALDGIAGDSAAIEAAAAAREATSNPLYTAAFTADNMRRSLTREAQQARAPFAGVGLSGAADDLATPGLRELAQRPMFKQAVEDARRLAANKGVALGDPLQSLEGLHYIKLALDDALNPEAKSKMGKHASSAVMSMRDKLADELAEVSPLYGNARQRYSELSQPINEMEALQALRVTDAQGNITLSKVQNAIRSLEGKRAGPRANDAKSITDENLQKLFAIRDDLLRQARLGLGRPAESATFQNIATNNALSTMLPGKLGDFMTGKFGTAIGQVGQLAYSQPNAIIRGKLLDSILDPTRAEMAMLMARHSQPPALVNGVKKTALPWAYRSGPALGSDQ